MLSLDMAGYSHDMRRSLARIAALRGDSAAESRWKAAAADLAAKAKASLWEEGRGTMVDR